GIRCRDAGHDRHDGGRHPRRQRRHRRAAADGSRGDRLRGDRRQPRRDQGRAGRSGRVGPRRGGSQSSHRSVSASLVLHIAGVSKTYGGLRPLRIDELRVSAGDRVALLGLDQAMAEVLVNLITGAAVPDQGALTVFGRPTTAIAGAEEWLAVVDRFGIVSERAVLLEGLTAIQNLSLPFTVEIEPPSAEVRARASALAREAGLSEAEWDAPVGALAALSRTRLRI